MCTLFLRPEKVIDVEVEMKEYLDKLTDHCICMISCMCIVEETKQTFADMEELRLRKPHLQIKVMDFVDQFYHKVYCSVI